MFWTNKKENTHADTGVLVLNHPTEYLSAQQNTPETVKFQLPENAEQVQILEAKRKDILALIINEPIKARRKFFEGELLKVTTELESLESEHEGFSRINTTIQRRSINMETRLGWKSDFSLKYDTKYLIGGVDKEIVFWTRDYSTLEDKHYQGLSSVEQEQFLRDHRSIIARDWMGQINYQQSLYCGPLPTEIRELFQTVKNKFDEITIVSHVKEYFTVSPAPMPVAKLDPIMLGWVKNRAYFIAAWDWETEFEAMSQITS